MMFPKRVRSPVGGKYVVVEVKPHVGWVIVRPYGQANAPVLRLETKDLENEAPFEIDPAAEDAARKAHAEAEARAKIENLRGLYVICTASLRTLCARTMRESRRRSGAR